MFNDRYGLTLAVLEGRKTMTRRIVQDGTPLGNWEETVKKSRFKVGEVVAVAQSYRQIEQEIYTQGLPLNMKNEILRHKGYTNKMFVRSGDMPHSIRIADVHIERLQDISDEDCLKEGVLRVGAGFYIKWRSDIIGLSAKGVFSILIDKMYGKGTWNSNPWVFVYEFELIS